MSEKQRLKAWKAEALVLLEQMDRIHGLLPEKHQAYLGESKIDAVERYVHMTLMGRK